MKTYTAMAMILAAMMMSAGSAMAQKGLYVGAGLGHCSMSGDVKDNYDPGAGYHFLLGFKVSEKLGLELEYGGYEQKNKSDDTWIDKAGFGGVEANMKYFFGPKRERPFRPYCVAGLGLNAFAWKYKSGAPVKDDEDGVGALSLIPGLGFELMVGRIAALNVSGRYAFNGWGEETANGAKVDKDFTSHALLFNAGLILHL